MGHSNKKIIEILRQYSHDSKTALNGIIGFSDLLASTELTDKQKNYLEKIQRSGDVLLALIKDSIDYEIVNPKKKESELIETIKKPLQSESIISNENNRSIVPRKITVIEDIARQVEKSTLLVVDDSAYNRELLYSILENEYIVILAEDHPSAMSALAINPSIDLVLLDIIMPVTNGFEVCKELKSIREYKEIPVIFITGLNDIENEKEGFRSGGADFITKPFNRHIIQSRIKTHIQLREEKRKSDTLLKVLLPDNVIRQLKSKGTYAPELHKNTSVMFCDLIEFTEISSRLSPNELIDSLTDIFTAFDTIIDRNCGMRIKTIGDGYLAVTGMNENPDEHANNMVAASLEMIAYLEQRDDSNGVDWKCRIGINSGEIISGIVGQSRFQFDIMGDNVNIASRVESNGEAMRITITESTRALLSDKYTTSAIGPIKLKGKGQMELFLING